jgi:microcystin-dependent protein
MTDQFVAEIRMVGFNFAPTGWAQCDGQLLPISQNTALFSLLGTFYGGDGKSTFALPDLQGASPIDWGQGQGLSNYDLGQMGGTSSVTLIESEIPAHSHTARATTGPADVSSPTPTTALARSTGGSGYAVAGGGTQQMDPSAIAPTGGSLPHNNLMPYLVLNFCIAMQGIFPQHQ